MDSSDPDNGSTRKRRPRLKLVLKLCVVAVAMFVLLEASFRFLLFHDSELARSAGAGLRVPGHYASRRTDDFWKLRYVFNGKSRTTKSPLYDPVLGWRNSGFRSGTYEHEAAAELGTRRPILLYGDSFGACTTPPEDCWQGLLARSELARDHLLLNYSAGGYGVDQIVLLFMGSIDRYSELNPRVIIGILVDDDLDRSTLTFRGGARPILVPDDGPGLRTTGDVPASFDEYIEEHPLEIASYAWRRFAVGTRVLPASWRVKIDSDAATTERTRQLSRRILDALAREIEARGLDAFVVVFHGPTWLDPNATHGWREPFLIAELERVGLPYVSSRRELEEDVRVTGRGVREYFDLEGAARNHYTALGNEVVFRALLRGLRGEFDG